MCDGAIVDIKSFMQQVRRAKAAIRAALEKEGGIVSEDMECVVEGLHTVNPTAPNPAADIDLWAGDFELLTHNFGSICTSRSRLVKIKLTQLYLDQDLHIMRPSRCLGKLVVLGRPVSS
ncbi:hypothetical protein AB1Y20_021691 [Prymnesium parvum]|uniref:Uncharacterized protein n=1 Tax=Prymnesium parvum TaxID=97485 RepID=A0AB34JMY2_PRYPA